MATNTLDGTATPYAIAAGSTVTVDDGDTLILLGTINNQGTILENSTGDYTEISIGGTAVTLTGGGNVVLSQLATATSDNQNFIDAEYDPSAAVQTLTNIDDTIAGSGEIFGIALDNQAAGVIDADGAAGNELNIYANGMVNAGLIEATAIGGLFISSLSDFTVDQSAGGTILASGAGVQVEMYMSDVVGGTLATTGGGTIAFVAGTLDGSTTPVTITAGSTVTTLDSASITLLGTIDNAGTFAGSGVTNEGSGTLDATGSLTLQLNGGAVRNAGVIEATTDNGLLAIDDAAIDNTGGTLLADTGIVTFDTVTLSGGAGSQIDASNGGQYIFYNTDTLGSAITNVTIGAAAPISVYGTLDILSGVVSNAGIIEIGNSSEYVTSSDYHVILNAATTTLEGGGTVQFVSNVSIFVANDDEIVGATTTPATLINVDNTIDGSGEIGSTANPVALVNDASGTINASGGYTLTINSGMASVSNAGLIESTESGGLVVNGPTLDNTGGTLLTAGNVYNAHAGKITLNGVDVIGGTLTTNIFPSDMGPAQRGEFDFAGGGGTLDGRAQTITIGNLSQLMVDSGSTLDLLGAIAWQGADLQVSGTASNAATITGTGQISGDLTNTGIVVAQGGAFDITGAVSGAGSLAIAAAGMLELGGASTEAADYRAISGGLFILDAPTSYTGALTDMVNGDLLQLDNLDVASTQVTGTTLAVTLTDSTVQDFSLANLAAGSMFMVQSAGSSGSTLAVECFAAGTHIRTCRGGVAVEALQVGDMVPTCVGGVAQRVVWIGRRHVDCQRHPEPRRVQPVRVSAHAFGLGQPARDLLLSPDHAVYVEDVLIPVKYLINRHNIVQLSVDTVTYYHVELARHDVVWAEGLPVESYFDSGNRSQFANGGASITMHPDFVGLWEACGCAPLIVSGPALVAARARLDARLAERAAA